MEWEWQGGRVVRWMLALSVVALLGAGCRSAGEITAPPSTSSAVAPPATAPPTIPPTTAPAVTGPAVLAAGDVASCASEGDEATAALIEARPGLPVLVLGDTVYETGTAREFADCYAPSWGRFKERTKPAPGNHDYGNGRARGYLAYFGVAPWYGFHVGSWHLIALDSNCPQTRGGCGPGSPQEQWLRAELAAHRDAACTLAYWHHPRFSSGPHGSSTRMAHLWSVLAEAGADVVLAGHDHHYERFEPLDGIRSFVVGTGGRSLYPISRLTDGSEVRNATAFGLLELTLGERAFAWRFLPAAGATFTDTGQSTCR